MLFLSLSNIVVMLYTTCYEDDVNSPLLSQKGGYTWADDVECL